MKLSSDGVITLEPGEVLGPIARECEHELRLIAGDAVIVMRWPKRCGWTRSMRLVYGKGLLAPATPKAMMFPGDAYQVTAGPSGVALFVYPLPRGSDEIPVADWNPPEELLEVIGRGRAIVRSGKGKIK